MQRHGPTGGGAANPLNLPIDNGPSREGRRHNLVVDGSYLLPFDFQVAGIWKETSGAPYQWTSLYTPYHRLEPRGGRRGEWQHKVDLRVTKNVKLPRGMGLMGFWEMFNALNTRNFGTHNGSMESSQVLQVTSAQAMRRRQLGIRFDF